MGVTGGGVLGGKRSVMRQRGVFLDWVALHSEDFRGD